jgi:chromosome partitioning protein
MRVLAVAAQKGGSGKSTLASSLAVAAAQAGERVAVVDLDPQGSLAEWGARREAQDIQVIQVAAADLSTILARIRETVSLVILDTPGTFDTTVTAALRAADLTVIPVRPSIYDLSATRRTVEALGILGRRFAFVLNQVMPSSPARAEDAARALVATGPLAPAVIAHRADYLDAAMTGQGVTEWAPVGKAAAEITALWTWISGEMGSETK